MPKCYNNLGTENNSEGQYSVHTPHGTHTNILKSKMFNLPKNNQSIIVSRQKKKKKKESLVLSIIKIFLPRMYISDNQYFIKNVFSLLTDPK